MTDTPTPAAARFTFARDLVGPWHVSAEEIWPPETLCGMVESPGTRWRFTGKPVPLADLCPACRKLVGLREAGGPRQGESAGE